MQRGFDLPLCQRAKLLFVCRFPSRHLLPSGLRLKIQNQGAKAFSLLAIWPAMKATLSVLARIIEESLSRRGSLFFPGPNDVSWRPAIVARRGRGVHLQQVKSLRQFAVVVLLLMSSMAPAMACMRPDAQMSVAERACCRMMQNQCGHMQMQASQGCCKAAPLGVQRAVLAAKKTARNPEPVQSVGLVAFELLVPVFSAAGWLEHPESVLNKPPPSTVSILRI